MVDIADVRELADQGVTGETVVAARTIVAEEADRFVAWTRAGEVEPTIRAVRGYADQVRRDELERLSAKLSTLDDRQRESVEALTRGIVNTLLHGPTVRLKELADGNGADLHADTLRELFDLPDDLPETRLADRPEDGLDQTDRDR